MPQSQLNKYNNLKEIVLSSLSSPKIIGDNKTLVLSSFSIKVSAKLDIEI